MNKEIKNTIKNEKGFTLVELIVVIAILAILAAVAVPNYVNYQYRSALNTDISTAAEAIRAARITHIEKGNPSSGVAWDDIEEFEKTAPLASDKNKKITDLDLSYNSSDDTYSIKTSDLKAGTYGVDKDIVENDDTGNPKPVKGSSGS